MRIIDSVWKVSHLQKNCFAELVALIVVFRAWLLFFMLVWILCGFCAPTSPSDEQTKMARKHAAEEAHFLDETKFSRAPVCNLVRKQKNVSMCKMFVWRHFLWCIVVNRWLHGLVMCRASTTASAASKGSFDRLKMSNECPGCEPQCPCFDDCAVENSPTRAYGELPPASHRVEESSLVFF